MCACVLTQSCPTLCNPMTVACPAPVSIAFPRQEYWSGLPFSPPGDLGVEPPSPVLASGLLLSHLGSPPYSSEIHLFM